VIEGKIERRERRRKQILDDLKTKEKILKFERGSTESLSGELALQEAVELS
jgi:hypothetical protein